MSNMEHLLIFIIGTLILSVFVAIYTLIGVYLRKFYNKYNPLNQCKNELEVNWILFNYIWPILIFYFIVIYPAWWVHNKFEGYDDEC